MIVLKFAESYGQLYVTEYDSLESAVRSAMYASEEGYESPHHIEVIDGDSVRLIDREEVTKLIDEMETERWREYSSRPHPQPTIQVLIESKTGGWAVLDNFVKVEDADAEVSRLTALGVNAKTQKIARKW